MKLNKCIAIGAAVAIAGGLAATGVALATTSTNTYTACVTGGGQLYHLTINGTPKCSDDNKTITWNETGPRGYTGSVGPRGKAGATGPTGPQGPPGEGGYATTVTVPYPASPATTA